MTDAHAPIAVSGSHWLADLSDCRCKPELLADADLLHVHCVAACLDAGMNVLRSVFQSCPGAGVTGAVLLAQSHLSIHTWPEARFAAVDVYLAHTAPVPATQGEALLARLVTALQAGRPHVRELTRHSS